TAGDDLRNHAAHGHANHMRLPDLQRIEQPYRITRHVVEQIAGRQLHAQRELEYRQQRIRLAQMIEMGREAVVAVIEANHVEATLHQPTVERFRPRHGLHAETDDEQYRWVGWIS